MGTPLIRLLNPTEMREIAKRNTLPSTALSTSFEFTTVIILEEIAETLDLPFEDLCKLLYSRYQKQQR